MAEKRSAAFRRFIRSLDAPISSREQLENLDLSALSLLEGSELKEAESRLIERLQSDPDERVVRALAMIPTATAEKALRQAITDYRGGTDMVDSAAFEALLGLIQRGDEPQPVDALIEALHTGGARTRALAAEALAGFAEDRVIDALTEALRDDEYDVRRDAAASLFEVSGLGAYAEVWYTPLWLLKHWLKLPWPSIRDRALADLAAAVAQKQAGILPPPPREIPEDSPVMNRFLDSMLCEPGQPPWADDFDLEALDQLEGVERDRVEFSLIQGIDRDDPRIPRALSHMGASRALEPLRARVETSQGPMRDAVEAAIDALS